MEENFLAFLKQKSDLELEEYRDFVTEAYDASILNHDKFKELSSYLNKAKSRPF